MRVHRWGSRDADPVSLQGRRPDQKFRSGIPQGGWQDLEKGLDDRPI